MKTRAAAVVKGTGAQPGQQPPAGEAAYEPRAACAAPSTNFSTEERSVPMEVSARCRQDPPSKPADGRARKTAHCRVTRRLCLSPRLAPFRQSRKGSRRQHRPPPAPPSTR